jgi:hypothetical protein
MYKHKNRNIFTERERLPLDRFTCRWCQMKEIIPIFAQFTLDFITLTINIKKTRITIFLWRFNMGKNFKLAQLSSSSDTSSETLTQSMYTRFVLNESSICLYLQRLLFFQTFRFRFFLPSSVDILASINFFLFWLYKFWSSQWGSKI